MSDSAWYLSFAWGRAPYALDLPEVVIGRGDGATLQIEEPAAEQEHARFIVDEDNQVWLEPLRASNPTLVNGKAINRRMMISDGDFVQIGTSVLTLRRSANIAEQADDVPEEIAPIATVMMESPLMKPREPQRTVEANVDDLMAAIRKADAEKAAREQEDEARRSQATMIAPAPQPNRSPKATLMGVGEPARQPRPEQKTDEVAGSAIVEEYSEPRGSDQATMTMPAVTGQPTMAMGSAPHDHATTSMAAVTDEPEHGARSTAPVTHADLASAPTMIGEIPSGRTPSLAERPHAEVTPLPAPLPASPSIPDLAPIVAAVDARHAQADAPPLSGMATQQLAAVHDTEEPTTPLAQQKTMLPTAPPARSTDRVKPIDANAPASQPRPVAAYTPPVKGPYGSFSRALDFFQQMFALTRENKALLRPMYLDLTVATVVSLIISALLLFIHSAGGANFVMLVGVTILYFIDYACNALTASLLFDYANTGQVDMPTAQARVKKSLGGILTFAAVSAVLDMATTYARERHDFVSKILLNVLRAIWTTATYAIMPAMIIEGLPFKAAFARSKQLMEHDPTGVGAGVVALSICTYVLGAVIFSLAFTLERIGAHIHPVLGVVLFFTMVNLYWAVTGWLKIAYSTCFYIWVQRCEGAGRPDEALAPLPLRHALAAG